MYTLKLDIRIKIEFSRTVYFINGFNRLNIYRDISCSKLTRVHCLRACVASFEFRKEQYYCMQIN